MADELYSPGISFKNPRVPRIAAPVKGLPWFYEQTTPGPLSAANKLKKWENAPALGRYKAVWNRTAKARNTQKLGAYFHDVQTLHELGEAPPATSDSSSTTRDILGFLNNAITSAGQVGQGLLTVQHNRIKAQQQMSAAQAQSMSSLLFSRMGSVGTPSIVIIGAIGVAGLVAYLLLRR
jgi:hypothetical protein